MMIEEIAKIKPEMPDASKFASGAAKASGASDEKASDLGGIFGAAQKGDVQGLFGKAQDTVKIPTPIAKQIAKELVSCDSLKAIHELTVEQLTLTESKVVLKDSIISNHVQKGIMYEECIKNEQLNYFNIF